LVGEQGRWRGDRRLRVGFVVAGAAFVAVCTFLVPWGDLDDIGSWNRSDKLAALGIVLAALFTVAQVIGPSWWEARTRGRGPAGPPLTAALVAEWRCVLVNGVITLRGGQLDRLATIAEHIRIDAYAATTPASRTEEPLKLRLGGGTARLTDLPDIWNYGRRRLVLLGEAGSGKSFAALETAVTVTRRHRDGDGLIAEVFLLADWYSWQHENPDERIEAWMIDQLVTVHGIPELVAGALVAETVVPVFDGLDEVPEHARGRCRQAIENYSGKAIQRPFLLTCRIEDLQRLRWVEADQTLTIRPLDAEAIIATLAATPDKHPDWDQLRGAIDKPGSDMQRLLSSPLLLTTALASYVAISPVELTGDDPKMLIWKRFLTPPGRTTYRHQDLGTVRGWLTWLATAMQHSERQTIGVHELTFLDPQRDRRLLQFKSAVGLVCGLVGGLAVGLVGGLVGGLAVGLVFGLAIGLALGLASGLAVGDRVRHHQVVSLRARLAYINWRRSLVGGLAFGLVGGLAVGLVGGLAVGLAVGLAFGLAVGLVGLPVVTILDAEIITYSGEIEFGASGSRDLISASARAGLSGGLAFGLVVWLVGGLVFGLAVGLAVGLVVGLAVGLAGALAAGLFYGLDAVVCYWQLTRRFARRGWFPARPDLFLEWCAGTRDAPPSEGTTALDRRWMRQAGDRFQFRHRDLQEALAGHEGSLDHGPRADFPIDEVST
jgi:hypothetical protein